MKTILFDLDGTLLPMNQKLFTERYLYGLAAFVAPYGFEPEEVISSVWKGTGAMVQNDGTMTNEERFWQVFQSLTGRGSPEDRELFLKFYETERTEDFIHYKSILRCQRGFVDDVRSSLALVNKYNSKHISISTIGVSGTIRASQKFI